MRLWYRNGSTLLRTGNSIYEKWRRKMFTGYVLNWAGKWKLSLEVYFLREPVSVKFPGKCNCLNLRIWDQRSNNSWRPTINKLPNNIYSNYYHMKKRSCDTIVCLFGVLSTWQVVWVSNKVNDPTMSGVVLVLMLARRLLAWNRLWF